MKVLVTRPEPGASATAKRLAAMGHAPILLPCLTITPRPARLPDAPAAIIVTSAQAIPALPDDYHGLPVFCVGDATAARLREAGFSSVLSAAGDAKDLARLILRHRLPGTHLLAVGERHGQWLAAHLREAGVKVLRRAVYTASPIRALPDAATQALSARCIAAALFYSAETVRAFARLRPAGTASVTAVALSAAVAAPLAGLPWSEIRVAVSPTEADLLALLK